MAPIEFIFQVTSGQFKPSLAKHNDPKRVAWDFA